MMNLRWYDISHSVINWNIIKHVSVDDWCAWCKKEAKTRLPTSINSIPRAPCSVLRLYNKKKITRTNELAYLWDKSIWIIRLNEQSALFEFIFIILQNTILKEITVRLWKFSVDYPWQRYVKWTFRRSLYNSIRTCVDNTSSAHISLINPIVRRMCFLLAMLHQSSFEFRSVASSNWIYQYNQKQKHCYS